jgi:transcriptional regulator with XRE-family HTH domain
MDDTPEIGALVEVRGQRWVVSEKAAGGAASTLLDLQSVEDGRYGETLSVIWEVEPGRRLLPAGSLPDVTPHGFDAPDRLAAFLDAVRRQLIAELKQLREAAGLTQDEVAERLDWHPTKVFRIETGRTGPHPNDVRGMLDIYGVKDQRQREALIQLAKHARKRGWWYSYRDVLPSRYEFFIGRESEASSIRTFELAVIPGLLQNEDYARALVRGGPLELDLEDIERRVEVRMTRQRILTRKDRPQLWAILDEAAIRRTVGGPEVMHSQLQHLITAMEEGKTTIQVVPYDVGAYPGTTGSFIILGFPTSTDVDVVYMETIGGNLWVDKAEEVEHYVTAFDHLRAVALSPDDTRDMLLAASEALT